MEEWFTEEKIKLASSVESGRYLVAEKQVTDNVLLEEVPYAFSIENRYSNSVCQYCCRLISPRDEVPTRQFACFGCSEIAYCSSTCQTEDKLRHTTKCVKSGKRTLSECDIFYKMHNIRGLDNEATLDALKFAFIIKITKETNMPVTGKRWDRTASPKDINNFSDFAQLIANNSSFTEEENELPRNTLERLSIDKELWDEIITIHHQCLCNAYCISVNTGITRIIVGRAIYIKGSFFNHSCRPNVFFQQIPGTAIIQYLPYGTVKEGEPLYVAYVSPSTDLFTRQESLLDEYKFVCRCIRCEEDKEYYKTLESGS